jgi:hypothetical protein
MPQLPGCTVNAGSCHFRRVIRYLACSQPATAEQRKSSRGSPLARFCATSDAKHACTALATCAKSLAHPHVLCWQEADAAQPPGSPQADGCRVSQVV